jgi:Cap4 dsDNA endonuclease
LGTNVSLHEVEPREQVGGPTAALYEFQYHQAAAEALTLLDDAAAVCLYCEWHDDYVTETNTSDCYAFHQVKTRTKTKGPWPIGEFFGLAKKKKNEPEPKASDSSIFAYLWAHNVNFGASCRRFVFVTDNAIDKQFQTLLDDLRSVLSVDKLQNQSRVDFDRIKVQTSQALQGITDESLFTFLRKLEVQDALGVVKDLADTRVLIASRISDLSEIDLKQSEAKKIGADLVSAVRVRSQKKLKALPQDVEELRREKGLVIDDILSLLSLSVEGYRQLKATGRESVRALSRLQRLPVHDLFSPTMLPWWKRP